MAEAEKGKISPSPSGYNITRTAPDKLVRHDISDEELEALADLRRDYLWEGKWVAVGVALGVAPSVVSEVLRRSNSEDSLPMNPGTLFEIVLFFVATAVAIVLWYVMRGKGKTAKDLVAAIRSRTAEQV